MKMYIPYHSIFNRFKVFIVIMVFIVILFIIPYFCSTLNADVPYQDKNNRTKTGVTVQSRLQSTMDNETSDDQWEKHKMSFYAGSVNAAGDAQGAKDNQTPPGAKDRQTPPEKASGNNETEGTPQASKLTGSPDKNQESDGLKPESEGWIPAWTGYHSSGERECYQSISLIILIVFIVIYC